MAMAAQQLQTVLAVQSGSDDEYAREFVSTVPALAPAPMSADCPMMVLLAEQFTGDATDKTGSSGVKECTSCQLCMSLASDHLDGVAFASFVSAAPPVFRAVEHFCLPAGSVFKPPIY